jgi:hypothetical protein
MVQTVNKKNKRNNKTSRTRKRKLIGGRPIFIKTVAQYKDGILLKYIIQRNKMDKGQQEGYAKLHKVFYSLKEPSNFWDILNFDAKKMKLLTKPFFSPSNPENTKLDKIDNQTIVINSLEDIEDVRIANQIIQNIMNDTRIPKSSQKYDNNIPAFIQEYKKLIKPNEQNEGIFLANTNITKGRKMLKTPVFLNIIGKKYGYITNELHDLEDLQQQMDAPPVGTVNTQSTSVVAAAIPQPDVVVPKHIQFSRRLKDKIASAKS